MLDPDTPLPDDTPPPDEPVGLPADDVRLYAPQPEGWKVHVKQNWEKQYCYGKFPGQDYYHLILNGEIFIQRGDERFCLTCALRHGFLTTERLYWQHRKIARKNIW